MADQDTSLPIRTQSPGDIAAQISDGTTPSQKLAVSAAGEASVRVKNDSSDPVPIQGGNSTAVTVDGTVYARLKDGAGTNLTSELSGSKQALDIGVVVSGAVVDPRDIRALTSSDAVSAHLKDGSGTAVTSQANGAQRALDVGINVAGTQVDPRAIRALTSADVVSANLRDESGSAYSADNPLPVSLEENNPGDELHDFDSASAIGNGVADNHDYTVPVGKSLKLYQVLASNSGKMKVELQIDTDGGAASFVTKAVQFASAANPNLVMVFSKPIVLPAGAIVRLIRTNKEGSTQDLYSTFVGILY